MAQTLIKSHIDHVYSWRCPVNRFTDVSFIMVIYRENAFYAVGDFCAVSGSTPRV